MRYTLIPADRCACSVSFLTKISKLRFCTPAAYHDIFSSKFDGIKDPTAYASIGAFGAETFFTIGDPIRHRERYRAVASLFTKAHFERFELTIQRNVERFSQLLSSNARAGRPSNLALGYHSLVLAIVSEFIFSNTPKQYRGLASGDFNDPFTVATANGVNWAFLLDSNFPNISACIARIPPKLINKFTDAFEGIYQVREIITALLDHEKDPSTPKNKYAFAQRLLNAHLDPKSHFTTRYPDVVVIAEAEVTMWGGINDMANLLPYGTFHVSRDMELQETLYKELKSVWLDVSDPVPPYEVLSSQCQCLNALMKESMPLTHGPINGPPRLVGSQGATIDRHFVPPGTVVTASTYNVHMDPEIFPEPEKFKPERWLNNENDHSSSIVVFARGRRACPAIQLAKMEILAAFATVFRRFKLVSCNNSVEDFEWNEYFSIRFNGRPLQATLEERKE